MNEEKRRIIESHMFKLPFAQKEKMVSIEFEGTPMRVPEGISIAAALLGNGITHFRETDKTGEHRSPYCNMGICFECLVEVDGISNCQACLMTVRDGMRIKRQFFAEIPSAGGDA